MKNSRLELKRFYLSLFTFVIVDDNHVQFLLSNLDQFSSHVFIFYSLINIHFRNLLKKYS
jgi:hypothetical protein